MHFCWISCTLLNITAVLFIFTPQQLWFVTPTSQTSKIRKKVGPTSWPWSKLIFGFKTNIECWFVVSCLEILDKKESGTVSGPVFCVARAVFSLSPSDGPQSAHAAWIQSYHISISRDRDLNVNYKTCQHENILNLFLSHQEFNPSFSCFLGQKGLKWPTQCGDCDYVKSLN